MSGIRLFSPLILNGCHNGQLANFADSQRYPAFWQTGDKAIKITLHFLFITLLTNQKWANLENDKLFKKKA